MGGTDIEVARRRTGLARSVAMVLIASVVSPGSGASAGPSTTSSVDREYAVIDRVVDREVANAADREVADAADQEVTERVDQQVAVVLLEHRDVELIVPTAWLPPTAGEGSWLQIRPSFGRPLSVRIDHVRTRQVRTLIEERHRALLDERVGRRFPAG